MGELTVDRLTPLGTVVQVKLDPDLKALTQWLEFAIGRMGTVAEAAAVLASGGGEAPAGVAPTSSQTFVFNNFGASPASEPPETIKTIASKARRTPTPEALEEAQAAADAIKRRQEAISAAMNARRQPKPDEPQW